MWFISLFRRPNKHLSRVGVGRSANPSRHKWSFTPRLELLEDRALPSTLTVLNNLDSGTGSLRDTIKSANSGDTIVFDPSLDGQTITLTSDELAIKKSVDIEGPGASLLAISGNDTFRVFDIVNQGLTVTIAGLTITHGQYAGGKSPHSETIGGAGIANASSTLIVANDVLSYNQAANHGGAIWNSPGGVLTASNSTFLDNRARGMDPGQLVEGGAIWNSDNNSSATILGCTFIGNQAIGANGGVATSGRAEIGNAYGGAIHTEHPSSPLIVENSTFIDNQAIAGNGASADKSAKSYLLDVAGGGAIANHPDGFLAVSGCTFTNNQAVGGSNSTGHNDSTGNTYIGMALAGGVENDGTATVSNSTFAGNEALGGNHNTGGSGVILNGVGRGGGLHNNNFFSQGTLTLSNCTFTNNQVVGGTGNTGGVFVSDGIGGGLQNFGGATATVTGTTFSGNQAIGGAGGAGQSGGDGLGAGINNLLGSTLTISSCAFIGNQAIGGAGGSGANGGNGLGGGIYNDGTSTLTVTGSTVSSNQATGGAGGVGGSAGQGVGGGVYFASGGVVCLDLFTSMNITGNTASTSNNDVFGVFTICP